MCRVNCASQTIYPEHSEIWSYYDYKLISLWMLQLKPHYSVDFTSRHWWMWDWHTQLPSRLWMPEYSWVFPLSTQSEVWTRLYTGCSGQLHRWEKKRTWLSICNYWYPTCSVCLVLVLFAMIIVWPCHIYIHAYIHTVETNNLVITVYNKDIFSINSNCDRPLLTSLSTCDLVLILRCVIQATCLCFPVPDINECLSHNGPCPTGQMCFNTVGSYTCQRNSVSCGRGYHLNEEGTRCVGESHTTRPVDVLTITVTKSKKGPHIDNTPQHKLWKTTGISSSR